MSTGGLENLVMLALLEFSFAKDGGAIGDIVLRGNDIPKDALVLDGMIDVEDAVLSGGAATIALKIEGAGDILVALGKASFATNAMLDVVPVGTAATAVRTTAHQKVTATIAVAALTAGKFTVALRYILSRD